MYYVYAELWTSLNVLKLSDINHGIFIYGLLFYCLDSLGKIRFRTVSKVSGDTLVRVMFTVRIKSGWKPSYYRDSENTSPHLIIFLLISSSSCLVCIIWNHRGSGTCNHVHATISYCTVWQNVGAKCIKCHSLGCAANVPKSSYFKCLP